MGSPNRHDKLVTAMAFSRRRKAILRAGVDNHLPDMEVHAMPMDLGW